MYQLPITGKELEDILIKNKADLYPCDIHDNTITVSVDFTVVDGSEIKFKSPVNCSQVTNLFVTCTNESKDYIFNFVDANGNDIGVIDNVFNEGAIIKVILDVTNNKAFIQSADTNSYIENTFVKKEEIGNKQEIFTYPITTQAQEGQGKYIDSSENRIVKDGCNVYVFDNPAGEHDGETVTIRTYIYGDMAVMRRSDDGTSLFVINEGADENSIEADPKKGIFEYTYTFNNLDVQGHDLTHFQISFCDNAYMDSPEIILHKRSVWEEIKRTQSYDHIVAQGKSGDWTYRKWNSGVAECWAHISVMKKDIYTWSSGPEEDGYYYCTHRIQTPFAFKVPSTGVGQSIVANVSLLWSEYAESITSHYFPCMWDYDENNKPYNPQQHLEIGFKGMGAWSDTSTSTATFSIHLIGEWGSMEGIE